MKRIEIFNNFQCPFINGIFLHNGEIFVLDYRNKNNATVDIVRKLNFFDDEVKKADLIDFDYMGQISYADYQIRYGEGSFGGDGVVGLFLKNELVWFLFLENSNPFCKAIIKDHIVFVQSTNGVIFSIPIDNPQLLQVVKNPDFL